MKTNNLFDNFNSDKKSDKKISNTINMKRPDRRIKYKKEKEYYDAFKGDKTSYVTFIARVRKYNIPMNIAIKVGYLKEIMDPIYERKRIKNDPLREYYNSYQGDKISFRNFKEKVRLGTPKEEAIKRVNTSKGYKFKIKRNKKYKEVLESYRKESYYLIEITYPKEIATIYRGMYISKIQNIEDLIIVCNSNEIENYEKQLIQLKKELEVFNRWNPL